MNTTSIMTNIIENISKWFYYLCKVFSNVEFWLKYNMN